jgi:hypothetical protein
MNQTGPQAPMEATATRVYRVSGDVPVDDEVPMVPIVHRDQGEEENERTTYLFTV